MAMYRAIEVLLALAQLGTTIVLSIRLRPLKIWIPQPSRQVRPRRGTTSSTSGTGTRFGR